MHTPLRSRMIILVATLLLMVGSLAIVACSQQTESTTAQAPAVTTPSPQPKGHEGRWAAGGYTADACMSCHSQEEKESKATKLPEDHFVNKNPHEGLVGERTQCATCHVEQTDH